MKKTLSINISGIIFYIEEDGYETLRKYLDSINKYFGSFEDSSEILADIESRIAEIFLAKLSEGKQVITSEDVTQLIATMGNVSDFRAAEETDSSRESSASGSYRTKEEPKSTYSEPKKLVRDQKRKILGGVCAGMAHYFSIDPVWTRLIFALFTLAYGTGLLAYIILWIVVPGDENLQEESSVKKMYRNPEGKVLGGVAGGVASFFGIDKVLMRVLFVALAFAGGFGVILYIILWISIPEAKTITEKMEMQGEPVTLSNIESNVKKSMNEKDKEESIFTKIILFPFRLIGMILNGIAPVFKVILDVLRVMIGLMILLLGVFLVLAVLLSFGLVFGIVSASSLPESWTFVHLDGINLPLDAIKASFPMITIIAAFFVALIPALFIQWIGGSIMAKKRVVSAPVGWSMFVIFFLSVLILGISLPRIIFSFKQEGEYKTEQIFDTKGKIPVLKINEAGLDDYRVTDLEIKGYDGTQIKLEQRFQAQGSSRKQAVENAKTVTYQVVQSDSIITFDSNITFNKDAKFRAQRLDMKLYIPYDKPFVIDEGMWNLLENYYGRWEYSETDKAQTWKIKDNKLVCVSCPALPKSEQGLGDNDQYGLKDFDELDVTGVFNLIIKQGDRYSIEMDGNEEEKRKYEINVSGNTLEIDYHTRQKSFWERNFDDHDLTKIYITMPSLSKIKVKGAGKIRLDGFHEDDLDISLTGAMTCDANLHAQNLDLEMTGPMVFELDGDGDFMQADVTGVAQLKASGYEVRHAIVSAHGMASAKVNARQTVEIETDLTGSVKYQGNPEVIKRD
jgi:phage shock protein PspC (stress-responsive transcriptional regulator)